MSTVRKTYRNGADTYVIEFRQKAHHLWEIYCVEHPHNPNSTSVVRCHLYPSGEVCVSRGKEPKDLDRATAICLAWMNNYSKYIRNGGTWPKGKLRVNV